MDNLWAFLGLGVVTVANLATTVIDKWRSRGKAAEREQALTKVTKSVTSIVNSVNNRPDTTRDQLDRIERVISGVQKDVGRLADAAVDDRETHRADIARHDAEIAEIRRRIA
jgi:phage shock protein A